MAVRWQHQHFQSKRLHWLHFHLGISHTKNPKPSSTETETKLSKDEMDSNKTKTLKMRSHRSWYCGSWSILVLPQHCWLVSLSFMDLFHSLNYFPLCRWQTLLSLFLAARNSPNSSKMRWDNLWAIDYRLYCIPLINYDLIGSCLCLSSKLMGGLSYFLPKGT